MWRAEDFLLHTPVASVSSLHMCVGTVTEWLLPAGGAGLSRLISRLMSIVKIHMSSICSTKIKLCRDWISWWLLKTTVFVHVY